MLPTVFLLVMEGFQEDADLTAHREKGGVDRVCQRNWGTLWVLEIWEAQLGLHCVLQ